MTHYHVRLTIEGERHDETKLDLDDGALERVFLAPYRTGRPITVNGRSILPTKISRVRISCSDEASDVLLPIIRQERLNSSVAVIGGPSDNWRVAAYADDVTDQFITGPPGEFSAEKVDNDVVDNVTTTSSSTTRRNVFLVTGRDGAASSAMVSLLNALGLRVIEWEQAVARTNIPNPYVGDVITQGMKMADAALVLITPDDVVRLRHDLVQDADGPEERSWQGQARPNVIYEAGIADTIGRERTVIVEVGSVKSFSDVSGRHVVRFDGSPSMRNTLASRLRTAGLAVDTTGNEPIPTSSVAEVAGVRGGP